MRAASGAEQTAPTANDLMPARRITHNDILGLSAHNNSISPSQSGRFSKSFSFSRAGKGTNVGATVRASIPVPTGQIVLPPSDELQAQTWDPIVFSDYIVDSYLADDAQTHSAQQQFPDHHELQVGCGDLPGLSSPSNSSPTTFSSGSPASARTQQCSTSWNYTSTSPSSYIQSATELPGSNQVAGSHTSPVELETTTPPDLEHSPIVVDSFGFDCPLRAAPGGDHHCSWSPKSPNNGLKDMNRVREHVGKHGLSCENCDRVFKTPTDFKNHHKSRLASGSCFAGFGDTKDAFAHPITLPAETIISFFTNPIKLKGTPEEEWLEGYKILHSTSSHHTRLPSPYYHRNSRRHDSGICTRPSTPSRQSTSGTSNLTGEQTFSTPLGMPAVAVKPAPPILMMAGIRSASVHHDRLVLSPTTIGPVSHDAANSTQPVSGSKRYGGCFGLDPGAIHPSSHNSFDSSDNSKGFEPHMPGESFPFNDALSFADVHDGTLWIQQNDSLPQSKQQNPRKRAKLLPRLARRVFSESGSHQTSNHTRSDLQTVPALRAKSNESSPIAIVPNFIRKRTASTSSRDPASKKRARQSLGRVDDLLKITMGELCHRQVVDHATIQQLVGAIKEVQREIERWDFADEDGELQRGIDAINTIIKKIRHLLIQ